MRAARRALPRAGAILASGAIAAGGLTGCQLFEVHEPEYVPSAMESCVTAQPWVLDLESLRDNVAERLTQHGASGDIVVDGTQTLHWSLGGDLVVESDLTVSVTRGDPPTWTLQQTIQGQSTGGAVFAGDVAVPRDWSDEQLTVRQTMTEKGEPVTPPPWELGRVWIDDTVGLVMSCDADTLEVRGRGTKLHWTFHPEEWAPPAPTGEATQEPEAD